MNYLLASKKSYTSARILASHLGLKLTSDPNVIYKRNGKLLIRYGNTLPVINDNLPVHNSIQSIHTVADSVSFTEFCKRNSIRTAEYIQADSVDINTIDYPVLLRNRFHCRGKDIVFIENIDEMKKNNLRNRYIVPFIYTTSEIGIHVVNKRVVKIFKKVPLENAHPFIRNLDNNYHFKAINDLENNFKIAQELILYVFELLGLTFGRADIGFTEKKNDYIIWEINSAPGLNANTAKLYAENIIDLLNL